MKPVRTAFTNMVFKLQGGSDDNDLPVEKNHDADEKDILISTWYVSPQESQQIANGRRIELIVWGEEHPPVTLRLEEEDRDEA